MFTCATTPVSPDTLLIAAAFAIARPVGTLPINDTRDKLARAFIVTQRLDEAIAVLEAYGVPLLGGDTVGGAGPQAMGLTAIGRATHWPVPSRSGAKAGDALWITGALGAAMLGLEALRSETGDSLAYRRPQALLAEGQALAPHVTAMMDISDGLLLDAARMARASGVTLAIDSAVVPIATPEARRAEALRWGEDYQLLFTAPPAFQPPVAAFCIGRVLHAGEAPIALDGRALSEADGLGYQHNR